MDGKETDRWIDRQTGRQEFVHAYRKEGRQVGGSSQVDKKIGRQAGWQREWIDRETDRQANRQIGRQVIGHAFKMEGKLADSQQADNRIGRQADSDRQIDGQTGK
jgi:hypothetical protein